MAHFRYDSLDVLIVEPNLEMRAILREMLRVLGVTKARIAADPGVVANMLMDRPANLVLCDWSEAIDGVALTRWLRVSPDSPNHYVPVILITGNVSAEAVCQARDAGVNGFLAKPLSTEALGARVRKVMVSPRPFVESAAYSGPDRRSKAKPFNGRDRRQTGLRPASGPSPQNVA